MLRKALDVILHVLCFLSITVVLQVCGSADESSEGQMNSPQAALSLDDMKPPFDFTVRAVTPDGKPVPGVKIRCLHPRAKRGAPLVDMTVETDENGAAKFTVTKADLALERYFWFSLVDDAFLGNSGVGISPVDKEFTATFTVMPAETFTLRVVDGAGSPVPGAELVIWNEMGVFSKASTGQDGAAQMRFVDTTANVLVTAKGFAPNLDIGVPDLLQQRPFEVVLKAGRIVRGRVVDDKGNPVVGARVVAQKSDPIDYFRYWDDLKPTDVTGADGRFALADLAVGQYIVGAAVDDPSTPLFIRGQSVEVEEQTSETEIELVGMPGAVITGQYLSKHKLGLARRQVFYPASSGLYGEVLTAEDGSFLVPNIPAGSAGSLNFVGASGYHVRIRVPAEYAFMKAEGDRVTFENIPAGCHGGIEVEFMREARVEGRVVGIDGKPLASVSVGPRPNGYWDKTNANGEFAVSCPPDEKLYLAVHDNALQATVFESETLVLSEGQVARMDLAIAGDPSVDLKQTGPPRLVGKPLPDLAAFDFDPPAGDLQGRAVLVCFGDLESRPSRHVLGQLSLRAEEFTEKNVAVLFVHTQSDSVSKARQWAGENKVGFPIGAVVGDATQVLAGWGVQGVPWLVLADENRVVRAKGGGVADLDAWLDELTRKPSAATPASATPR